MNANLGKIFEQFVLEQTPIPRRLPARLAFGMYWLLSVVLYAAYTSNLVSFFTVTK